MAVNKKKEADYVENLFKGLHKQYKEKGKFGRRVEKIRVDPTNRQGRGVLEDYKRKCAICSAKYDDQPAGFEIHHIDGDRANAESSNFVLLCAGCHNTVHDKAGRKMDDIIRKNPPCVTVNDFIEGKIKVLKDDTEVRTEPFTGKKFRAIKDEARLRGIRRC